MQKDGFAVTSWLSFSDAQAIGTLSKTPTLSTSGRSKSGSLRTAAAPNLIKGDAETSLDRTSSHVSTSSLDSTSSAGGWSPRTAAAARSKPTARGRRSDRIRSGRQPAVTSKAEAPAGFTGTAELVTEASLLSNASFDTDASLDSNPLPRLTSRLSHAKLTPRGSDASLHSQHSILDPLPEKPTDVVRHRKVFGSTYSVGKLGELPYTPPTRTRGSLSQPPWVTAAIQKDALGVVNRDKLVTAGSLKGAAVSDAQSGTLSSTVTSGTTQQACFEPRKQPDLNQAAGDCIK